MELLKTPYTKNESIRRVCRVTGIKRADLLGILAQVICDGKTDNEILRAVTAQSFRYQALESGEEIEIPYVDDKDAARIRGNIYSFGYRIGRRYRVSKDNCILRVRRIDRPAGGPRGPREPIAVMSKAESIAAVNRLFDEPGISTF